MQPTLHICTFATERTKGFDQLIDSCKRCKISLDILGMGKPFCGYADKLIQVQNYLHKLPGQDVVLYVDAYDVLFLSDEKTILNKFLKMNVPFVISAGRDCFPFFEQAAEFSQSPTSFSYINAGSYMGYVDFIKQIFDECSPIQPNFDDQGALTLHYLKHKEKYVFDHYCEIFLPLNYVLKEEVVIDKEQRTVRCVTTNSVPCSIHGNGFGRVQYQHIYDTLFASAQLYADHLAALESELIQFPEQLFSLWKDVGNFASLALTYAEGDFDAIPPHLQKILLENSHTIHNIDLAKIRLKDKAARALLHFPHLQKLDLSQCDLSEQLVETLEKLRDLVDLDLSGNPKIGAIEISRIAALGLPLSNFKCNHFLEVTNHDLQCIARLPMQYLYLHFTEDLTEKGVHSLTSMSTLNRIHLFGDASFTDKGIQLACQLPLKSVLFNRSQITDEGLSYLTLPLQQIHFISCDGITDKALEILTELPYSKITLVSLTLHSCGHITDEGLQKLSQLSLQSLQVILCPAVTHQGLEFLRTLKLLILIVSDCMNPSILQTTYFPTQLSPKAIEFITICA